MKKKRRKRRKRSHCHRDDGNSTSVSKHTLLRYHDNIVVMWIVLIRENVTAGESGRIDKGTEKRLEMNVVSTCM